jgi:hypothetical protein
MNAPKLAKLYDRLTALERLPLILAAEFRGDEAEVNRLQQSAPSEIWWFPDYLMPNMALQTLSQMYIVEQLDHLANYWHARWRFDLQLDSQPEDWLLSADVAAYELNIDSGKLTAGNYLGWILQYCEEQMPKVAPSPEAITAQLRRYGHKDGTLVTADSLLESWRSLFRKMTSVARERRKGKCDGEM